MLKVMHIFMEHVHLLWHLMAFYIRNLAAKGLMVPILQLIYTVFLYQVYCSI